MSASDSARASAYSTLSTSHSNAWRYEGPVVMIPFRAWYLELEVSVVGDRHELGVGGSSQYCMISASETDYLEHEGLLSEVGRGTKADGQVDLPERSDPLPWGDAMEWCGTGLDLGFIDHLRVRVLGRSIFGVVCIAPGCA